MKRMLSFIAALSLSTAALAHEYKAGGLDIDHPMAFETGAKVGGGYMTITNSGDTADTLIEVKADFPRVEIHETVEEDGVAKMNHVGRIDIPAGETVMLKPGGLHVMFMGLDGDPFVEGETIPATLVFENAGRLEVVFNVEPMKSGMDMNHDHAGHSMGSGS